VLNNKAITLDDIPIWQELFNTKIVKLAHKKNVDSYTSTFRDGFSFWKNTNLTIVEIYASYYGEDLPDFRILFCMLSDNSFAMFWLPYEIVYSWRTVGLRLNFFNQAKHISPWYVNKLIKHPDELDADQKFICPEFREVLKALQVLDRLSKI
jgi:hypothetical protein